MMRKAFTELVRTEGRNASVIKIKERVMNPGIFRTTVSLNVYENDDPEELGTQVSPERYVEISTGLLIDKEKNGKSLGKFLAVRLCEDGYEGLIRFGDYLAEVLISEPFTPNRVFGRTEILNAIPNVIAFLFQAMQTPNRYLWGGTLGPNFDCSGLVQAAFASQEIWLPRDSKDQHEFTKKNPVRIEQAVSGDLLFFSSSRRKLIMSEFTWATASSFTVPVRLSAGMESA